MDFLTKNGEFLTLYLYFCPFEDDRIGFCRKTKTMEKFDGISACNRFDTIHE